MRGGAFEDTPATRCAYYRRVGGLAAGVDPGTGSISVRAGSVWGLGMPAHLGQRVRDELGRHRCASGPIVGYPRSRTWTFLVRPDLPDSAELFARLYGAGVAVYRTGSVIALPSPADRPPTVRYWVERPLDTFRPSGTAVVAAIGRCVSARGIGSALLTMAGGAANPNRGMR